MVMLNLISQSQEAAKTSLKVSLMAVMVSLAACGGGGSDGYYGGGSTTPTPTTPPTPTPEATNYHILLASNKPSVDINGDTVVVTARLLDVNGGGVEGQSVSLAVPDTLNNGVTISGASSGETDDTGAVSFTLKLDANNIADKATVLANGIKINATFVDASGKITAQTRVISVIESTTTNPTTALYHLNLLLNKPALVVTGDTAIVTVKAVDENGGGVAGQTVTLSIPDTKANKVTIDGASSGTTDSSGNVSFNVELPNTTGTAATALIKKGITINSTSTDTNGVTSKQSILLNVVAAPVAEPVGNITFGNSAELASSDARTYYLESLSVNVVDIDGKPIINQPVTMSIDLIGIRKGWFISGEEMKAGRDAKVAALKIQLAQAVGDLEKATIQAKIDVLSAQTIPARKQISCPIIPIPAGTAIAPTFVKDNVAVGTTVTYTTDSTGKFDFQVRYLRKYASWQSLDLTAKATVEGKTVTSLLDYPLKIAKPDADSDSGQPFDTSPYGTSGVSQADSGLETTAVCN